MDYENILKENEELKKTLKTVLIFHNYRTCFYCKNYNVCETGDCKNYDKYELDLERVMTDYQVK